MNEIIIHSIGFHRSIHSTLWWRRRRRQRRRWRGWRPRSVPAGRCSRRRRSRPTAGILNDALYEKRASHRNIHPHRSRARPAPLVRRNALSLRSPTQHARASLSCSLPVVHRSIVQAANRFACKSSERFIYGTRSSLKPSRQRRSAMAPRAVHSAQ